MGIEIWHNPAEGTGRGHFANAFLRSVKDGDLDRGLGKVGINFIHGKTRKGYFNVLRVDGVYYDLARMRMNDPIRRAIETHDLVIYQSSFSKIFAEKMLGVIARKDCVIHNGTGMSPHEQNLDREDIIVASSRWRTNKRPKAIARAFVHASDELGMVAKLVFVGDVDQASRVGHPNIHYIGSKNHDDMRSLYHRAKLMVHVCHLDSCPNSVVEGLRMGLPVLCNNIGGTKELIDENCMTSNIDREFTFRPIASMDQVGDDAVDHIMLGRDMSIAFKQCNIKYREDMSMTSCASKYAEAIRKNI